jgi:A/G-specific adenine glycosylase
LASGCAARAAGDQLQFPGRKPRKALPVRSTCFLVARSRGDEVWLEKRPSTGIWGGLWCFPEGGDPGAAPAYSLDRWGVEPDGVEILPGFRHTFSHYHLDITPVVFRVDTPPGEIRENSRQRWYDLRRPPQIGLAAPVAALLEKLAASDPATENRE